MPSSFAIQTIPPKEELPMFCTSWVCALGIVRVCQIWEKATEGESKVACDPESETLLPIAHNPLMAESCVMEEEYAARGL